MCMTGFPEIRWANGGNIARCIKHYISSLVSKVGFCCLDRWSGACAMPNECRTCS
jgi:hypothetical protein